MGKGLWNANSTRGRDSARQRAFRKAAFELQQLDAGSPSEIVREPLSEEEAHDMFTFIENNRAAKFGLVKLAKVDLNRRYSLPKQLIERLDRRETDCIPDRLSLLEYACWTQSFRDGVIKSILNAHANPFYPCECEESQAMYKFIREAPPNVRVWLVKHLVMMWLRATSASVPFTCSQCDVEVDVEMHAPLSETTGCIWPTCGHQFCCKCVWNHVSTQRAGLCEFLCPTCGVRQLDDVPPKPFVESPEEVRRMSLGKFEQLSDVSIKDKKPKFKGLPMSGWARTLLSNSKGDRQAKFWHAVMHGNLLRAHVLLEEGVDINMKNEYGQTAFFMACWLGYSQVGALLLSAGADWKECCNQGVAPLEAAVANGHEELVGELVALQYGLDAPQVERSIPRRVSDALNAKVEVLIPVDSCHPGAGAFFVENCFSEEYLNALSALCDEIPNATETKKQESCSDRSYVCDSLNWISHGLEDALKLVPQAISSQVQHAFSLMRFLKYTKRGGYLAPHVDLARQWMDGTRSTHTFILYLDDCEEGGETSLLQRFPENGEACQTWNTPDELVIKAVQPKRGRLLVFPHVCPHEGRETVQVPKRLLRGELYGSNESNHLK